MAGVEMIFTLDDRELERQIEILIARGSDLSEPLENIGHDMLVITQRAFELSRSPEGVAWLPSAAATREGRQTLIDTGRLGKNQETFSWIVSAFGVVFGTNVVYAAIHQFGGPIFRRSRASGSDAGTGFGQNLAEAIVGHMTARPFVGASETDQQRWADILAEYIAGPSAAGTGAPA